jgi:hypothetical protein
MSDIDQSGSQPEGESSTVVLFWWGYGARRSRWPPRRAAVWRIEDFIETEEGIRTSRVKRWRETLPNDVSYTTLDLVDAATMTTLAPTKCRIANIS